MESLAYKRTVYPLPKQHPPPGIYLLRRQDFLIKNLATPNIPRI